MSFSANGVIAQFIKRMDTHPHEFTFDEYYLVHTPTKITVWVANGETGADILINPEFRTACRITDGPLADYGSLKIRPNWWLRGRLWKAFQRLRRAYQRQYVADLKEYWDDFVRNDNEYNLRMF